MPHLLTDVAKPVTQRLIVEFNREANKLRLADINGHTLAVYSNGAVYRVAPETDPGCVIIAQNPVFPGLVDNLVAQGIVQRISYHLDKIGGSVTRYDIVRVLI